MAKCGGSLECRRELQERPMERLIWNSNEEEKPGRVHVDTLIVRNRVRVRKLDC